MNEINIIISNNQIKNVPIVIVITKINITITAFIYHFCYVLISLIIVYCYITLHIIIYHYQHDVLYYNYILSCLLHSNVMNIMIMNVMKLQ